MSNPSFSPPVIDPASPNPLGLDDQELFKNKGFVDGKWVEPEVPRVFEVVDPGTGQRWTSVHAFSSGDVPSAVAAAKRAFPSFSTTSARSRSSLLLSLHSLVQQNRADLARLLAFETGKPIAEALGEVDYGLSFTTWMAGEAERVHGQVVRGVANTSLRFFTIKQPVGPVALLTPWNFPFALMMRKMAIALAAGCTLVAKPSPETPCTALAIAVLATRAGLPAGVFNVLPASMETTPEIGRALCEHVDIKKVSFTGSTGVGRLLMGLSAPTLKKMTLELGGNGACVVFDDADLDEAAAALVAGRFRNAGQVCIAAQRVFVHAPVAQLFAPMLLDRARLLRLGHSLDPDTTLGPLTTPRSIEKAVRHVEDAKAKGARVLHGGSPAKVGHGGGYFFEPTVIEGCTDDMELAREESFAPILALFTFQDEREALSRANATSMGLTNYVFTRSLDRAWRMYEGFQCGNVGINTGVTTSAEAPFGGVDQSGFGKEAGIGVGLDEYLVTKTATMALSNPFA